MENINGFYVEISINNGALSYKKNSNTYGVYEYNDENLTVLCQTSSNIDEACKLADSYLKNDNNNFIPSRYTRGSFVIIDKTNKLFFAGRDYSQANRLYMYKAKDSILISSDSRIFLEKKIPLDASILDFVLIGIMTSLSWFKGVKAILPGHYFKIKPDLEIEEKMFWNIKTVEVPENYQEATNIYGELLLKNIKNNIKNDTAAVYLSGGSDSSAVVGALAKLQVKNVYALHMAIDGNFMFERDDVLKLKEDYHFNLDFITPPCKTENWIQYVDEAIIRGSINSSYLSFPTYQMMGLHFKERLPKGTTVFNGEMCILDTGFTDSGASNRNFMRWLFTEKGRLLASSPKIWPDRFSINWDMHRKPYYLRNSWKDKLLIMYYLINTVLHSIGRPDEFYLGMKMGWGRLPGYFGGLSYLPKGYHSSFFEQISNQLLDKYSNMLKNMDENEWKRAYNEFIYMWYCESSNFTMPSDVANIGHLSMCFPFSDVDLLDFASSLPHEWKIDKKIQKDACKHVYGMSDQVAYRMKNHKQDFSYFDYVYGIIKPQMINKILNTDYGPLTDGIRETLKNKPKSAPIYLLYALAVLLNKYKLKIE